MTHFHKTRSRIKKSIIPLPYVFIFVFFLKVHTKRQRQIHNLIAMCNKSVIAACISLQFTDANNSPARNYDNIFGFIAV